MTTAFGTSGTLLESLERRSRTSRIGAGRITLAVGILILGTMIVASVAAPLITSYKPDAIDPLHPLLPPLSPGHVLGTDSFGRDIFSRILYGGRIDLLIALRRDVGHGGGRHRDRARRPATSEGGSTR